MMATLSYLSKLGAQQTFIGCITCWLRAQQHVAAGDSDILSPIHLSDLPAFSYPPLLPSILPLCHSVHYCVSSFYVSFLLLYLIPFLSVLFPHFFHYSSHSSLCFLLLSFSSLLFLPLSFPFFPPITSHPAENLLSCTLVSLYRP